MTTIDRDGRARLTISEAKCLILEASPREQFIDVFEREDGTHHVVLDENPRSIFGGHLDADFAVNCAKLGIVPTWKYRPGLADYAGDPETDDLYSITHDDLVRLAAFYGVCLEVGAPLPPLVTEARPTAVAPAISNQEDALGLPSWLLWCNLPEVELWQAVALSMNLEPDRVRFNRNAWMAGPGDHGPFIEADSFRRAEDSELYGKRLRLLKACLHQREHFSPCSINMNASHRNGVRLAEFAKWALSFDLFKPLPKELARLRDATKGDSTTVFIIEARPQSVPRDLLALADDATVAFEHWAPMSNGPRARSSGSDYRAGDLKAEIRQRIDRQREGWFTALEVAHIIARERPGSDEWDILKRLLRACGTGEIQAYDEASRFRLGRDERVKEAIDLLKEPELDVWLRATAGYGFPPSADTESTAAPTVAQSASAVDRGRRVKRAALICDNLRRWPSIERDLKDAASNGLSEAAKDSAVGWWWEGSAIAWARARAKMQDTASHGLAGMAGTIHRLAG